MHVTPRMQALVQLTGVLAGFLAAVAWGHRAATYVEPADFQRFHQQISPDTGFYPPFSILA